MWARNLERHGFQASIFDFRSHALWLGFDIRNLLPGVMLPAANRLVLERVGRQLLNQVETWAPDLLLTWKGELIPPEVVGAI